MHWGTRITLAVTFIVLVVIVLGIYATYSTFTLVFTRLELTFSDWGSLFFKVLISVLCLGVISCFILGCWLAIVEIQGRRQKQFRFAPSPGGYYEAYLLSGDTFIKPADNVSLQVPHTYSPRIAISQEGGTMPLPPKNRLESHPITLEEVLEHLSPHALEFIYGVDRETGELVKTTLPKAVHIQLIGATTMGKSHEASAILTQLVSKNNPSRLQLALIDHEGETSAPFQNLPHTKYVAGDPKQAVKTLRELVRELERRDITKEKFPIILVFVEEFLTLRRMMPEDLRDQALEDYTTLALRGAKRGIYLFSIGQTAYTEKHIRDAQMQFLSSLAFAIKPTAARSAGFTNTQLLNQLFAERKPGQFLLERPQGDSIILAPHVDYPTIPSLLTSFHQRENDLDTEPLSPRESQSNADGNPQGNQLDPALQAKTGHVCHLLSQHVTNKSDILFAVWQVKPGRHTEKYDTAEREYKTIMAYLASLHSSYCI
jgi:hypothetical protein